MKQYGDYIAVRGWGLPDSVIEEAKKVQNEQIKSLGLDPEKAKRSVKEDRIFDEETVGAIEVTFVSWIAEAQ